MSIRDGGNAQDDDPFASREGKALSWANVNMSVHQKGRMAGQSRQILTNVFGSLPKKKMSVILGPSGSGKTTLLNILAGRLVTGGKIDVSCDIMLDGQTVNSQKDMQYKKQIAYVPEDDISLPKASTPREAIRFSAKLRLSRDTSNETIDHLVEKLIEELDLQECADTVAGGYMLKGISKGERRRLLVGIQLVVRPTCVLLDEPISGLDSFHAAKTIELLKKVAGSGSSVLCTVHQPSSDIFHAFDHLTLINHGRVMYHGSASSAKQFFADCGFQMPQEYNPADWLLFVAQSGTEQRLQETGFYRACNEEEILVVEERAPVPGSIVTRANKNEARHVSFGTELREVLCREFRNTRRDLITLFVRLFVAVVTALVIGVVFQDIGRGDQADPMEAAGAAGAIMLFLLANIFGVALFALVEFPESRPVFMAEYLTDHYSISSYFISKLIVDALAVLPILLSMAVIDYFMVGFQMNFWVLLGATYVADIASTGIGALVGCMFHQRELAQEMLPLIVLPQAVLSGLFVAVPLIPGWIRWVQYTCSLIYANRLALLSEFGECSAWSCHTILYNVDADENERWWYWLALGVIALMSRVSAILLLRKKATKMGF